MSKINNVQVSSEIGKLEAVILHTPGQEVANMTPENAQRALYSDILNLSVAQDEYKQFAGVMQQHAQVYELKHLLEDVLAQDSVKKTLVDRIFASEMVWETKDYIQGLPSQELAKLLIEGVVMRKNTLTRYFSQERYSLRPMHNFFFTRDASMSINNKVLLGKMASPVRDRESLIMETIFTHHPELQTATINPVKETTQLDGISIEGGDVQVAREDVLVIGTGIRTTSQGIDFILEHLDKEDQIKHIIVQELPDSPESFIHLDMIFTFLDKDKCMVYDPIILRPNRYRTVHIQKDGKKVKIETKENILSVLKELGMDLEPVYCGGRMDQWHQDREQWHSGANFFSFAPGKVIGYGRNQYTVEEMHKHGFAILPANEVISGKIKLDDYTKYMVTIDGSELARGGGGARCMSMPVRRQAVNW